MNDGCLKELVHRLKDKWYKLTGRDFGPHHKAAKHAWFFIKNPAVT